MGVNDKARRKHGQDLASAATAFSVTQPLFDLQRFLATVKRLLPYVKNRYSSSQPNRVETGHIVMGAQYLAAEVMRQITGYSIRSALTPAQQRVYPPNCPHLTAGFRVQTTGSQNFLQRSHGTAYSVFMTTRLCEPCSSSR
jgi:hypothetical protein